MLPTIDVPAPIEQTVSGRGGAPVAGGGAAAGSDGRGGGAVATVGLSGAGGGVSGLPLKLLSMLLPLLNARGIPVFRRDATQALSRRRATVRTSLRGMTSSSRSVYPWSMILSENRYPL